MPLLPTSCYSYVSGGYQEDLGCCRASSSLTRLWWSCSLGPQTLGLGSSWTGFSFPAVLYLACPSFLPILCP